MSASWFVEDDTGRRGPFTRKQLRSLRAAYEIRPHAVVVHSTNGKRTTVDELLPEFRTGPLRRQRDESDWFESGKQLADSLLALVHLLFIDLPGWILIDIPRLIVHLVRLLFRTRFQFSLRTLMLFFLFVCPVLGIISNDIASTVRQQQIVNEWGGNATWRKDPWRFWKSDVFSLEIKNTLSSDPKASLDQLPELRSVHADRRNVTLTPAQYQKLFAARQIEYLSLPATCTDLDLAGIVELSELETLGLHHPEAYLTVRRLRGHPRLQQISIPSYYESLQLENDFATFPSLRPKNNWRRWTDVDTEYADIRLFADTSPPLPWGKSGRPYRERFQIAILGDNREQLFQQLRGNREELCTTETRFNLIREQMADFHLTVPLEEDPDLPPAMFSGSQYFPPCYLNNELRVLARVIWMADRVVLAVNAEADMTDSIRDQCRLIRVMRVPSWVLVFRNASSVSAERRQELFDECVREIGFPPIARLTDNDLSAVWNCVRDHISLRPPNVTFYSKNQSQKWLIFSEKELPFTPANSSSRSRYQLQHRGIHKHFWAGNRSGNPSILYDSWEFNPGEEIAIVLDNHIYCLGTIQLADESAETGSP